MSPSVSRRESLNASQPCRLSQGGDYRQTLLPVIAIVILIVALAYALSGAFSSGSVWPDGERYCFNGILIHDLIRDGAWWHPYEYAKEFYAKYPAFNLPYGPPVFAAVFAGAFSLFGISFGTAKSVVALYSALAVMLGFLVLYAFSKSLKGALIATAAFALNPLVMIYSRDITPELPIVFHSFLTLYFFYYYVEARKRFYGCLAAIALGMGYLTKLYIVPLGISLLVYLVLRKNWDVLTRRETWVSALILIILAGPYTIGFLNLDYADLFPPRPEITFDLLGQYAASIAMEMPVLLGLSLVGFYFGLREKDGRILLPLVWAVTWYIFFALVNRRAELTKYFITLMPSLLPAVAVGVSKLDKALTKFRYRDAVWAVFVGVLIYQAWGVPSYYVMGQEKAGEYVAKNLQGASILYYGHYDGSFMMGVRKNIAQNGPYILRGERVLANRTYWGKTRDGDKSTVHSSDQIKTLLNTWGTGYVVVERDMPQGAGYREYKALLEALKDQDAFDLVRREKIETNYATTGPELLVYKVKMQERDGRGEKRVLKIPVSGLRDAIDIEL